MIHQDMRLEKAMCECELNLNCRGVSLVRSVPNKQIHKVHGSSHTHCSTGLEYFKGRPAHVCTNARAPSVRGTGTGYAYHTLIEVH